MFVVQVDQGQEVIETISREAQERGVATAVITLIGAVEGC